MTAPPDVAGLVDYNDLASCLAIAWNGAAYSRNDLCIAVNRLASELEKRGKLKTSCADLETRLRRSAEMLQPGSEPELALRVAADALEALAKERDSLKADAERLTRELTALERTNEDNLRVLQGVQALRGLAEIEQSKAESALALAQRERDAAVRLADKAAGIVLMRFTAAEERDKAEAELAALKGQTCDSCKHQEESWPGHPCDMVLWCGLIDRPCNTSAWNSVGNRCGRWAKRETP
jgi:uncharacterized protein YhaN